MQEEVGNFCHFQDHPTKKTDIAWGTEMMKKTRIILDVDAVEMLIVMSIHLWIQRNISRTTEND